MANIGQYIKQQRIKANLSQQQIADHLQLPHRSMVHRRETGETKWSFDEVVQVAELLEIDLVKFIRDWQRRITRCKSCDLHLVLMLFISYFILQI